jgi:RHS repeat-associated protein
MNPSLPNTGGLLSPSPLLSALGGSSALDSYLASGAGLLPGLEDLALGGGTAATLISEAQLLDWSKASGTSSGASITGLSGDGGIQGALAANACFSITTTLGCPCPPPSTPIPCDKPTSSTPNDCPCSDGSCQVCPASGFSSVSVGTGGSDVRSASGIGSPLQWSNNTAATAGGIVAGNGWSYSTTPKLVLRQSDVLGPRSIALPFNGTDVRTFERSATDASLYVRSVSSGATDVLRVVGTGASAELHYKGADGSTIRFAGMGTAVAAGRRGQYLGESDAAGNRVEATLNANGSIAVRRGFQAGSATADEVQRFTYTGATSTSAGRLSEIRVERADGTLLRRTELSHYTTATSVGGVVIGRAGDLREVVVRDGAGGVLERSAFRYSTESRGRSVLAYVLDDDSQRRLAAAGLDRNSISNAQLAPYAKDFFAYDSQNRVIRHDQQGAGCTTCTGGIGTTSFDYFTRTGGGTGFNSWRYRTTETGPDGNQTIRYTNGSGQSMLEVKRVLVDPANPALVGKQWGTFTAYDATTGLTALQATPESVQLPTNLATLEAYDDLLNQVAGNYQYLSDSEGAITRSSYGTSTTATEISAGDARGFLKAVALTRGELGGIVPQTSYTYFNRSVSLAGAAPQTVNPLASVTRFRNDDGTGAQTTSYSYAWYLNSTQASMVTTTLPLVGADQNGPGTAAVSRQAFDRVGREIWSQDADGFLTFTQYDAVSGTVLKRIVDVNTSLGAGAGGYSDLPAGWSTPAGGGLHLATTHALDSLGRVIRETDPNGNVDITVYDDVARSQRRYTGWNSATGQATGPTVVTRQDASGSYSETLTMSATPASSGGLPTGTEAISTLQSLSRSYSNAAGQLTHRDDYFDLSGLSWSTAANLGTEGVNFYRTTYSYNKQGLLEREQSPTGTITYSVYDGRRRLSSTWIGTNDSTANGQKWSPSNNTGSSNLVQVAAYTYDNGGVGNGNLTQSVALPGIGANRVREFAYDWRDRLVASKSGVEAVEAESVNRQVSWQSYDNLGQVISRAQYDGDGVAITADADNDGVPDAPDPAKRRRFSRSFYDNQGRMFRGQEYLVDQSSGAVYDVKLQSDSWFDQRGNTIQSLLPNGPARQSSFDGAGRLIRSVSLGNLPSGSWADAASLANSVVLEQQDSSYDANGNVILTSQRQRFHDADPTATGALGTASSGIRARLSSSTAYYDAADRQTAAVSVGSNGGSPYSRPAAPPAASDTALVTLYGYDAAGRLRDVTDPMGRVQRSLYDALGRRTTSIANDTGGAPGSATDVTTRTTYNGNGQVVSIEAVQPAGTPAQITQYLYEARTATGSAINSNDLLTAVLYPDPLTGVASASQKDSYQLNALGDRLSGSDRNGTVHSYGYDVLGRRISDAVTTLGAGVDGAVRRIEVGYDGAGQAALTSSYDAASGGAVLNQVGRVFNGFGQLTIEWQSHLGAINLTTTPKVSYGYSLTSGGNHSRPTSLTHPDGYVVGYGYDSGLDATISRLSRLSNGATTLESYRYLGASEVVERARPEVGITLSMISQNGSTGDGGDQYTGLDRFGRLVDQRWFSGSGAGAVDVDRYGYTYDRNSNRLTRSNALQAGLSESYSYDGLNQLTNFDRGGGVSSQQWQFDALGNWTTFTKDGTPESRSANAQNEYTTVGGTPLSYSANGNLIGDAEGRQLVYDAWNRLVSVSSSGGVLKAAYGYDGLNRRISEQVAASAAGDAATAAIRDLFYSADWQVLEERLRSGGAVGATAEARYVWSPVYVDAMVLRERGSERVYALQDGNWNTTALIAAAGVPGKAVGEVIQRMVYNPYGEVFILNPDWTEQLGTPLVPWQHLFQGLKFSEATGLGYVRNRDYSPTLGRFIMLDPLGFDAGDNNWYRFVGNTPTGFVDPSGKVPQAIIGAAVGCSFKGGISIVYSLFRNEDMITGCCKAALSCVFGAIAGAVTSLAPAYAGCAIPIANAGAEAAIKRYCSKNKDNASATCDIVSAIINALFGCLFKDVIAKESTEARRILTQQVYNGLSKIYGEAIKASCNFQP